MCYDSTNEWPFKLLAVVSPTLSGGAPVSRLQVAVIGHSQGGTLPYMALTRMPEVAAKMSVVVGLAPVFYARYMTSPVLTQFCKEANVSVAWVDSCACPHGWRCD